MPNEIIQRQNTEVLDELANTLSPLGRSLFIAASVWYLKRKNEDPILSAHKELEGLCDGLLYYRLARDMVEELEQRLVFAEPIPFPIRSKRIGYPSRFHGFYKGYLSLVFNESGGEAEVKRWAADKIYASPSSIKPRLYDELIVVDSLESFFDFLKDGKKKYRESNPFIPINVEPAKGDLVYCVQYAQSHWGETEIYRIRFGNVMEPRMRLGVVEDVSGDENARTYKIKHLAGETKEYRIYHYNHQHTREDNELDALLVVKHGLWSEEDLKRPFMTNEDAEDMIWPVMLKYGSDPRAYTSHMRKHRLMAQQYANLLRSGASGHDIRKIFSEIYGLSQNQLLELAGVQPKQLAAVVKPKLDALVASARMYETYASTILAETSKIMGMSEEELVKPITLADDFPFELEQLLHRKVSAKTYDGQPESGYVSRVFDLRCHGEKDMTVNLFNNMFNPLSETSVGFKSVETLGVDAYKAAISLFEVEQISDFLRFHTRLLGEIRPDLEDKTVEVGEFLEDIMETVQREVKEKYSKVLEQGKNRDISAQIFWHLRQKLDTDVIGPLLSFGYTNDEARQYVLGVSNNHPTFITCLDEIFKYREGDRAKIFRTNPIAREMLAAVMEADAPSMEEVVSICHSIEEKHPKADVTELTEARTILEGYAAMRESGADLARISEDLYKAHTGRNREYLHEWQLSGIIERFRALGRPSAEAITASAEQQRKQPGMVLFHDYVRRWDEVRSMELRITDDEIDIGLCTSMLVDEVLKVCKDDPRNQEYLRQTAILSEEQRISSFEKLPRLFPVADSNYYIVVDPSREYSRIKTARLMIGNVQPMNFKMSYDAKPDIDAEIQKLREAGFGVRIPGNHNLEREDSKYILIPEWEIETFNGEITLFSIGKYDEHVIESMERHQSRYSTRRSYTLGQLQISADHVEYFGPDRCKQVLFSLKEKIEKRFNLKSDSILQYAGFIEQRALSAPQVPLLQAGQE